MRNKIIAGLALALAFTFFGCDEQSPNNSKLLLGTWTVEDEINSLTWTFNPDGTATKVKDGKETAFKYAANSGKLFLSEEKDGKKVIFDLFISLDGKTVTLAISLLGEADCTILHKKK